MYTVDAQQALGFLQSQTASIEAQVYEIQYPDIQYPSLIPVDTSANQWATSVEFYSLDKVGQAQWFDHQAKDVPIADANREQHSHPLYMAAIGYRYTLQELGQAMMIPGMNLSADKASAARRAYEEFLDGLALRGSTAKGWDGLINSSLITPVTAAATGTGGSTAWADKSGDQIIADVNAALTGVYTGSLTVEMADTVALPVSEYTRLSTQRLGDTNMTLLQFLAMNNTYTAMTGAPLTIRAIRGLEDAGQGGTGRMVVYRRDPQVLKFHLPMPHQFQPVWQTGPLVFDVPGIFRTGGLEIRRPGAMRYVDGIIEVET